MEFETLIIVSGLADDHDAAREALTTAAKLVLGPSAVVLEPATPPAMGFELVLAVPEAAAALAQLRHALVLELQKREILHAELAVELLDE